ncbi:fluoride efflux transporter CrcB [Phosphitispora fastidiosa]|uniref:fluoride efflux transporter CrcB n=1 Tax=Phosphitispora fastidiosa TaxID=2837202 RepID=UPI001E630975|nr:fluoride efflux transporter CrcB [Phosphitispora fastidiosa]MBU7007799.1 CrcB protein [Phosphitispora fastidiosa]
MDYLAVAAAGFLGAVTRAALGKAADALIVTVFPLGILIVNLTGCLILSFFLTLTAERLKINPKLRLAVGSGFLGAYTTFSTFAVDSIGLIVSRQIWGGLGYIIGTSLGCIALAWLGAAAGRSLAKRSDTEAETSK